MNDTIIKASVSIIFSLFFKGFYSVLIPLIVLIVCELFDYVTGLMAARYKGEEITSEKSIQGIIKKVSMLLLVVVGAIVDLLIIYSSQMFGFDFGIEYKCFICCVICIWLVFNELISITENLRDMDAPIPVFMMPLLKLIKKKTEESVKVPDEN